MKLDPALLAAIDAAALDRLLGQEVLLRVFVEHAPADRAPFIEPYDLPTVFILEQREQVARFLDEFLEEHAGDEGTAFSMEVRPLPPTG
ncbi:MAG: hypothetical protein AMXMBFR64_13200 [Myxococcales bacterium]